MGLNACFITFCLLFFLKETCLVVPPGLIAAPVVQGEGPLRLMRPSIAMPLKSPKN
jgi:hypothetical protein